MPSDLREQLQTVLGDAFSLEGELEGGGMSRLFAGMDSRLGRQVVIKVLPAETGTAVSVERFQREIQVAARLQHPHIVPVLLAGEADGLPFYMMPMVKGESLRQRLNRGGELSTSDTVRILRDVAAALAYAHGEGIVHRDIKPDNVMLSGGVAVVTDFGVAKAVDAAAEAASRATGLTTAGVTLGTPAYMAPEQATADPHVDGRADIYAFGCVAYEMLAGASPFAGRPAHLQLAAHATESPEPLLRRRPNVARPLAELVMRCLEKRAADRPQSAEALIAALDAIVIPSGGAAPAAGHPAAARRTVTLGLVLLTGILGLAVVALWPRTPSTRPLSVAGTSPIVVTPALELEPAISPDGKFVAYAAETPAGTRIFVRQIEGGGAVPLAADLDGDHGSPRWAPDQSRIVFVANGAAFIVPALGGPPQRVLESLNGPVVSPAWSPDGRQLAYADEEGIFVRLLDGTTRKVVGGASLHSPAWSPDGTRLAYAKGIRPAINNISTNSIWVTAVDGGAPRQLSDSIHVNVSPVWTPDGRSILYVSNRGGPLDVYQQAVDPDGRPAGAPNRVTTTLNAHTISLSASGTRMVYDVVLNRTSIWRAPLVRGTIASTSSAIRITEEKESIEGLSLSHDGNWLAYDSNRRGNFDIYKVPTEGGPATPLTKDSSNDFIPSWSPDDREIAFHSTRNGTRDVYVVSAEGSAESRATSGPREDFAPSWSPDGRALVFHGESVGVHRAYIITRDPAATWSIPRVATPDSVREVWVNVAWSPDGSVIAFMHRGAIAILSVATGAVRVIADSLSLGGLPASVTWGRDPSVVYVSILKRGTTTAYTLPMAGGRPGPTTVYALPLDGGRPRAILAEAGPYRMRPEIATDDRRIFFLLGVWESDVWVMDLKW